jgi:hypothetical protein
MKKMETISTISTAERLITAAADDKVNKKGEIISTLVADEGFSTLAVVDIVTYRSGNNLTRAAVDKFKKGGNNINMAAAEGKKSFCC